MVPTFNRIAVINRGEPAIRLLHAVRELNHEHGAGFKTIALYTEPDRDSMFVREADEAVYLGPPTYVDSATQERKSAYLHYDRLADAMVAARAEAAWVGWGFVAEHAAFADLCRRLGVVFIGPETEVMRRLGDKIEAKRLAESAGVPVAPWSGQPVCTLQEAAEQARRLGYPVLLKASAGGGGRGIRFANNLDELTTAFPSARAETAKAFGDGCLFVEKVIVGARHVEVQIIADRYGTVWAAGVRDCSLQRRHQKVLEEAPCPLLDEALDQQIREVAVRLTRAAGYTNAGTVEFLFQPASRQLFFMEMNTRLQVEHPVTELTTGLDLVKLQFHVAAGGALEGPEPTATGHAVEVRLNAEDPDRDFAPAPGTLRLFRPATGPGVRIDTGVRGLSRIPPEFDSMIAKVMAHGRTRDEAMARLRRALNETAVVVQGGTSNKSFLCELLSHQDVLRGRYDTAWLDTYTAQRGQTPRPLAHVALLRAAIDIYDRHYGLEQSLFFESAARGRPVVRQEIGYECELRLEGHTYKLKAYQLGRDLYRVHWNGQPITVEIEAEGPYECRLSCLGKRHRVVSMVDELAHRIEVDGVSHAVANDEAGVVRAPAPAIVLSVDTRPGAVVAAGDRLVVLEAMKMEMVVPAPCAGRVSSVLVLPNQQVATGAPLVSLEPAQAEEQVQGTPASFPRVPVQEPSPLERCRQVFAELKRLFLGFDIDASGVKRAVHQRQTVSADLAPGDPELWALEDEILRIFADVLSVHRREARQAPEMAGVSAEEYWHSYLRSIDRQGRDLPEPFVCSLRQALLHYGAESLEPTPLLREALMRLQKARRPAEQHVEAIFGILERRLHHHQQMREQAHPGDRELLDRLDEATQQTFLPVNDLARQLRYQLFERPLFEQARAEVGRRAWNDLVALLESRPAAEHAQHMASLVNSPMPLMSLLSSAMADGHRAARHLALEVMVRRLFRVRELRNLQMHDVAATTVATASYTHEGRQGQVLATHGDLAHAPGTLLAAIPFASALSPEHDVHLDLYLHQNGQPLSVSQLTELLGPALAKTYHAAPAVRQVTVAMARQDRPAEYVTYRRNSEGFAEDTLLGGIHPMIAERLELWRLRNFHTRQLRRSDDVYLFHAVARDNPKDERLVAVVEVRDMVPMLDAHGQVVHLAWLERKFMEALAGIREFQARRPVKSRLNWNRVVMHIWPVVDLPVERLMAIARRLAPAAKHLGLEKIVLRGRFRDPHTGEPVRRVLHITNRVGTGLNIHVGEVSNEPVQPLTPYAQKVVRMRRLGLVYAYEIIRMLTPGRDLDQAEFPPGDFTEYDFDAQGRFVDVRREPGLNVANVVVGAIRNHTAKHPEGMVRVAIVSDASREMGALAAPECSRIVAALDLAETLGVPVEWFPVSSGARIAMDVGTEGLDWIARVLRRIVEFTQRGGEINVIVNGVNVGGQSYWNAEATMLMHTRGILVMTPSASMVLTGKRALDYSGGVSAEDNQGIGGLDRIMGPNGQAQYRAKDMAEACHILFRHYEHTYMAPGERSPRAARTSDPKDRSLAGFAHPQGNGSDFTRVEEVFGPENAGRKKPFDIRAVMRAVCDADHEPLERWSAMRHAEMAVVWDCHLGGMPVCAIGIESHCLQRFGFVSGDGPDTWTGGTLFPLSSKKVARAINAASGNRPVVIVANLSGFDGSPESMRCLQLEYGAEIGRAVVNFKGAMVFCVISRYHGGAYVVFSSTLNEGLEVAAVEGSHASVIGGAPAAAVVFSEEVKSRTLGEPQLVQLRDQLSRASSADKPRLLAEYDQVYRRVSVEKQGQVAEEFDRIHNVERALAVGSLHRIVPASKLRAYLIDAVERGLRRHDKPSQPGRRTRA